MPPPARALPRLATMTRPSSALPASMHRFISSLVPVDTRRARGSGSTAAPVIRR